MKRNTWQAAAFLGVLLTAATAVGQTSPVLEANIPFPFVVADHKLPAGRYAVSTQDKQAIRIANPDNQGAFVLTIKANRRASESSGKLVFRRYADTYFLAEVWGPGKTTGEQLYKSRLEEELISKGIKREIGVLRAAK